MAQLVVLEVMKKDAFQNGCGLFLKHPSKNSNEPKLLKQVTQ